MLSILGKHLDSLYLSVYVDFPEHLKNLFQAFKQDCQQSGDEMIEFTDIRGVPGGIFYIRPYGRGRYQYVMENASFYMAFSTWENMPTIDLQFKAETLYEYGPEALPVMVDRIVGYLFPGLEYKEKVSRADLAVDFQEPGFELPDMRDVVCRARDRVTHWRGAEAHGLTFGRRNGSVQAQIYCKSRELEQSEKGWMLDVWRASGEYRETLAVWRAEVRFYREGLRAFDVNSLRELLDCLGDLASYAVGDSVGTWLRVCSDDTRGERAARRSAASWWACISRALVSALPGIGRKRKGYNPRPSFMRCVELAGAHMARAASIARLAKQGQGVGLEAYEMSRDPRSFGELVGEVYREQLRRKRITWAEKVNLRSAELRAVAW